MVSLEQTKSPTRLRDSKRFYINAYYSVGYGHPLAYRLGYKTGDVLGYKGGFVEGLKNKIGPFDQLTLQQDSPESEVYDQNSDEDETGLISSHMQDALLYTSDDSGGSSTSSEGQDSKVEDDHALKQALISLYNDGEEEETGDDDNDDDDDDDEQW